MAVYPLKTQQLRSRIGGKRGQSFMTARGPTRKEDHLLLAPASCKVGFVSEGSASEEICGAVYSVEGRFVSVCFEGYPFEGSDSP